jgi:hypothetical protein
MKKSEKYTPVAISPSVARPLLERTGWMKITTAVTLSFGLLLGPITAYAQGGRPATSGQPPAAIGGQPPAATGGQPSPAASGPPPAGARPAAGDASSPPALPVPDASSIPSLPRAPCGLGEHSGVDDGDAGTAAQLVCTALARAGAPPDAHYRVGIGKLGSIFILSVVLEGDTAGSTADSREMRLASVEAVAGAAPKIATAIVHGTVVEDIDVTASGGAPSQAPPLAAAPSGAKVHFALGLIGQFPPLDRSATPAAGADLELHAELSSFAIVTSLRFGSEDSTGSVGVTFVEFSLGGRYFTSDANLSPFLGGGFAWSYLEMNDNVHHDFNGSHTGLGAYGEIGLEVGRLHHTHLAFAARLDLPFYSMQNDVQQFANGPTQPVLNGVGQPIGTQPPLVIGTLYYAPLSLEVRVTF